MKKERKKTILGKMMRHSNQPTDKRERRETTDQGAKPATLSPAAPSSSVIHSVSQSVSWVIKPSQSSSSFTRIFSFIFFEAMKGVFPSFYSLSFFCFFFYFCLAASNHCLTLMWKTLSFRLSFTQYYQSLACLLAWLVVYPVIDGKKGKQEGRTDRES